MSETIDRVIPKIALPLIALAAVLLIFTFVASTRSTGEQNNAYIRVNNCIVSKNAATRTQADIEECYKTVERETNTIIQRYDTSK